VEYDIYVIGQTLNDAEQIAVGYDVINSDTFDLEAIPIAAQVQPGDVIPDEWLDSIPFGSENDMTVRQYIEAEGRR
jgi:hypothetical protein